MSGFDRVIGGPSLGAARRSSHSNILLRFSCEGREGRSKNEGIVGKIANAGQGFDKQMSETNPLHR